MSTADELRAAARKLRTYPMSLADFIPLLQRAADELEKPRAPRVPCHVHPYAESVHCLDCTP